uniref:Uncharacterized protein n=1 Tax=Syphacia muris TaxID=451379 RepID=A0A0N5AGS5_9BILA
MSGRRKAAPIKVLELREDGICESGLELSPCTSGHLFKQHHHHHNHHQQQQQQQQQTDQHNQQDQQQQQQQLQDQQQQQQQQLNTDEEVPSGLTLQSTKMIDKPSDETANHREPSPSTMEEVIS